MKRIIFAALLLLAISPLQAADDCVARDLNVPEESSPLYRLPIFDQDGTGMCYAYAATQLVDYELMMEFAEKGQWDQFDNYQRGNPLYTAYSTKVKGPQMAPRRGGGLFGRRRQATDPAAPVEISSGGKVEEAINALKTTGMCTNNDVQYNIGGLKNLAQKPGQNRMTDAQLLFLTESLHIGRTQGKTSEQVLENPLTASWLHTCDARNFAALYEPVLYYSHLEVFNYLLDSCKTKPVAPKRRLVTRRTGSDAYIQDGIKDRLYRNRPAAIDVCGMAIVDPNTRGLTKTYRDRDATGNRVPGLCDVMHSVLVTGQKRIGNECHYQIRNSWGGNWAPPEATSCACIRTDNKYDDDCKPNDPVDKARVIEYVGCWFKRADILPNTGAVNGF